MSRRQSIEKPEYRFVVVDDTIHTWGVKDRQTNKLVQGEFRSSMEARMRAEELNINPGLLDES